MRILHVTAPGETGGLERVVRTLVAGLRERGHAVTVLASLAEGAVSHAFLDALRESGVPVRTLELRGRAWRAELTAIGKVIRELHPEVVHTHGFRSDVLGLLAARRAGTPTVSTVHGYTGGDWKVKLYERVQRIALRSFDAVVAVSHPLADDLRDTGIRAGQLHCVRNALEPTRDMLARTAARQALGVAEDAFVIGWVGRLSPEKGPDVFVDALTHLTPPFTAVMIGDGSERKTVELRAERAGLADRLRLCGTVPDAERYLSAFDVLVLSSRTEGTPMVLLEAMAARVPIVATAVGGVPHVVDEDEAILIPAPDPVQLARGIDRIRTDPEAARGRASTARHRFDEQFDVGPWVLAYEAVYRAAAERRRG